MGKKNVQKICLCLLLIAIVGIEAVGDSSFGAAFEIYPATVDSREEFETIANSLKPGDELILH